MNAQASTHPHPRLCIILMPKASLTLSRWHSMMSYFVNDDGSFSDFDELLDQRPFRALIQTSTRLRVAMSVCITEPLQEKQVLLSSLLPAYHTHMWNQYRQATPHDDRSQF